MANRNRSAHRAGFTLLELLIVVVVLGLAGALVVPAMGQTGVLRVQAAVRTIIADITFAQADAVAFQERRAIVFDIDEQTYTMVEVPGTTVDMATNTMFDPTKHDGRYVVDFKHEKFGGSQITSADFDGNQTLIFDALGGPVVSPTDDTPGAGGVVNVIGSGSEFDITVEPFTGRVTVDRVDTP